MTLDESNQEDDKVFDSDGVKVVYNHELEHFLRNAVIDYSWILKYYIRGGRQSSC